LGHRHPDSRIWIAPLLYGGATLAGMSRIYQDEHWASDVATSVLIGTVSGWKTAEYHRERD
jgi:hypothetical protein